MECSWRSTADFPSLPKADRLTPFRGTPYACCGSVRRMGPEASNGSPMIPSISVSLVDAEAISLQEQEGEELHGFAGFADEQFLPVQHVEGVFEFDAEGFEGGP